VLHGGVDACGQLSVGGGSCEIALRREVDGSDFKVRDVCAVGDLYTGRFGVSGRGDESLSEWERWSLPAVQDSPPSSTAIGF